MILITINRIYRQNKIFLIAIGLGLFLLNVDMLLAQINFFKNIELSNFKLYTFYQEWTAKSTTAEKTVINQFYFPIVATFCLGNRGSLLIKSSYVSSVFYPTYLDVQKYKITEISDMKIEGSHILGTQKYLFTYGFNIPLTKNSLTYRELIVASIITEDALDFPICSYGAGLEEYIGIFRAFSFSSQTISGGASYYRRGKFQFFENDHNSFLKPGDELTVTLGLNKAWVHNSISTDMYFTHRQADIFKGEKIYDQNAKMVLNIQASYKLFPIMFQGWLRNRWQTKSILLASSKKFSAVRNDLIKNPYQLELGGIIHYQGYKLNIQTHSEIKIFTKNERYKKDALVYGGGIMLNFKPIEWFNWVNSLNFYYGHLTNTGERFKISGYQICSILNFSF